MSRSRKSRSAGLGSLPTTATTGMPQAMTERASGAVSSTGFVNMGSQYTSPRKGVRELLRVYRESPWLRAIVGKIARHTADTDWFVLAKKGAQGKGHVRDPELAFKSLETRNRLTQRLIQIGKADRIEVHPMLTLLQNGTGNPRLNGHAALAVTQQHLDLVGEAFWIWERNALGVPVAFWPIPPSWIMKMPSADKPYYELSAPGGMRAEIPMTEVVPFIDPDPENPYGRGVGTAQSLDDEIQIDEFAAKHQKAFFLNRARPDLIISGQFISQKDSERLEKQWLSDHQGFWKAFKPLFFSQKIDVKEITQSFESMQMVQIRQAERDTFISVFGAPPEKFGIIGESKRSTIQAADYFWTKDIIQPRVEFIRRVLQQVMVPLFDDRLILAYDTVVIQDDEYVLEVMKAAPWCFSINEWQEAAGKKGLGPRGEFLVVPMNMVLLPLNSTEGMPTADNSEDPPPEDKPKKDIAGMLEASRAGNQLAVKRGLDPQELASAVSTAVAGLLASQLGEIKGRLGRPARR